MDSVTQERYGSTYIGQSTKETQFVKPHKNYTTMTYLGYENLQTGKFTLTAFPIEEVKKLVELVKSQNFEHTTAEWVSELVESMEEKNGLQDQNLQRVLLSTMIRTYIDSGLEFGNEDFYWFRTNGDRFHTIGRKLWKGAKKQDVQKFFLKHLKKDYDYVYQNW
jgi:hypothetical protein